jgi:hypothetical protein
VVQGVSSEPVSADFPVMQGNYREFSRIRPESALQTCCKPLNFLVLSAKFPTLRKRELNQCIRQVTGNLSFQKPQRTLTHVNARPGRIALLSGSNSKAATS